MTYCVPAQQSGSCKLRALATCTDGMQANCDPEHGLGVYVLCAVAVYCMARALLGSDPSDDCDGEESSTMYS